MASPHPLHYEHARAALEAGLHVMCEKPLTTRAAHARDWCASPPSETATCSCPTAGHHKPFIQRAKALMDEQAIGEVEFALCHMASPIRALLSGEVIEDVSDISGQDSATLFGPTPSTWLIPPLPKAATPTRKYRTPRAAVLAVRAARRARLCRHEPPGSEVELYDALTLRFTSGAIGTVSGAGNVPTDQTFQVDVRLFGSEGMLLVDCERARMHLRRHDGQHVVEEVAEDAGAYECDGPPNNFADLILGKTDVNWTPGEAAMRGVEMLDAAYRSATSGREEQV